MTMWSIKNGYPSFESSLSLGEIGEGDKGDSEHTRGVHCKDEAYSEPIQVVYNTFLVSIQRLIFFPFSSLSCSIYHLLFCLALPLNTKIVLSSVGKIRLGKTT